MSLERFYNDQDPEETREWLEAFASVVEREGGERALFFDGLEGGIKDVDPIVREIRRV